MINHNTCASFLQGSNLDLFETAIMATSQVEDFGSIINLSRQTLDQTGGGHFTPVGGYNAKTRKVLLLDTARFKYPPHWVDIELLYESIKALRGDGEPRGFIMLTRKSSQLERSTQPPAKVRLPKLPSIEMEQEYTEYLA